MAAFEVTPYGRFWLTPEAQTNHITQYSHLDSYVGGGQPGQTDAYLTQITYPADNGVTPQENFAYGNRQRTR